MKLEDQVCSLELSKRLKELGLKQESLYFWVKNNASDDFFLWYTKTTGTPRTGIFSSAFTVTELGEIIGEGCKSWKDVSRWHCSTFKPLSSVSTADTEADARALLLIFLIQNSLVKTGDKGK